MTKTCKPTVAGILSIIAGVFTLIGFIVLVIVGYFTSSSDTFGGLVSPAANIAAIWLVLSMLFFVIGVLAIIGGAFALQRKLWGLALAGSILVIFTSFYLGIPATILTAISRNEFE